ncbi:peptidyl-tRNA hydrolase [Sistotremastrum suecicum HHB10207 ss-3]|uniref:peptidyl-tRNA hydrolase n=1 Tax=Sistotremastrum suecicum HHB10207 ss-3 TaxID=1314776 RepID=A0A166I6V4_9AGAM|nr:peptidyl-tRNA hydrolase [Sistotremastrum suecicum HHB10207 ss-3]
MARLPGPLREILVVGLGNISHPATRHSAGHFLIDSLADRLGIRLQSERMFSVGKTTIDNGGLDTVVTLVRTKPLMNISGKAVSTALRQHLDDSRPSSMIVIHDSLDHKPFTVSSRFGGSAGGHNGVRDIIQALGQNQGFHRIRVGIGRPADKDQVQHYVLGKFSSEERAWWGRDGKGAQDVWKEIVKILKSG